MLRAHIKAEKKQNQILSGWARVLLVSQSIVSGSMIDS